MVNYINSHFAASLFDAVRITVTIYSDCPAGIAQHITVRRDAFLAGL